MPSPVPDWTSIYNWGKEIVLGLPSFNLAQRLMTYAFLSTAFIVAYLVILPRIDCFGFKVQAACVWIDTQYRMHTPTQGE